MSEQVSIPLKDDSSLVIKTMGVEVTKNDETGNLLVLSSTESVDSDKDVLHQGKTDNGDGWNLERFNKHPVMLWSHDPYRPSLGGGKTFVGKSDLGSGLHLVPKFDSGDEFAMMIEGKVRRKVIQETSVGFTSDNFTKRKDEKENPWGGYDFWDMELQEISWVNRGANPDVDLAVKGMLMRNPALIKQVEDFDDRFLKMVKGELVDRFNEVNARIKTLEDYIAASKSEKVDAVVKDLVDQFSQVFD